MKIDKILILGSTLLTEKTVDLLKNKYNLIGFVPSSNPTKQGIIDLPECSINENCDIKLSIQYDKILKDTNNAFNVHTGLLPNYGGTNILSYTLQNKEYEQGLTFHKMTSKLDYGPIISKTTYPVLKNDDIVDLYSRLLTIGPMFLLNSLDILSTLSDDQINECKKEQPTIYKRGEFKINKKLKNYGL